MRIIVFNGSPKGDKSVTLQYVNYIRKIHPRHELKIINIGQQIGKLERDDRAFQAVMDAVRLADGILWATPVYFFLVPANYKRFIELIFERGAESVFSGKYTAALTTSIHFFDHTAHNYLHAICDDLTMKYLGYYSADMYDLLKIGERRRLEAFAGDFFTEIENSAAPPRSFGPLQWRDFEYRPGDPPPQLATEKYKLLIVTDSVDRQSNLGNMLDRFKSSFISTIDQINLQELDIKGSCLGCLRCADDNLCTYEGRDDYIDVYKNRIMQADILIWAGTIRDRYLSSRWKLFFDRSFFKGHAPSLAGKQIGMIIAGPLSQVPNLRQILEAYVQMQQANLVGIVTDEFGDSSHIDGLLTRFAKRMVRCAGLKLAGTPTFLGIAGTNLFRDEIWGRLRFPFRADYLAYRRIGLFHFPQQNRKSRIQNALMLLLSRFPRFKNEINRRMKDEMIRPLQKFL